LLITPDTENTFLSKHLSGDEKAFHTLVDQYKNKVYNTCLGMLHHCQDAEDATQEVFIKVYHCINDFRGESKLSTWLYRITITVCLDFIRNRKRKKRFAFFQNIFGSGEERDIEDTSAFVHPGITLENKERAAVLFKAINGLPENQRSAFTLHKVEGLSYQEISEVLKVSLSSVESLMFRAKQNLQKSLVLYYKEQK
jgi:RNA polymerase sigma-70 factor (ECF subfamily)